MVNTIMLAHLRSALENSALCQTWLRHCIALEHVLIGFLAKFLIDYIEQKHDRVWHKPKLCLASLTRVHEFCLGKWYSLWVYWRGCLNSASVIEILSRFYRDYRPLCRTLIMIKMFNNIRIFNDIRTFLKKGIGNSLFATFVYVVIATKHSYL